MSERRPHWTNDLIEAVYAELPAKKYQVEPDSWEVHRIIAAVEDWMAERVSFTADQPRAVFALQEKRRKAEAAIARVRERAGGPIPAVHGDWMAGYAAAMRDILSALGHDIEMEGKR